MKPETNNSPDSTNVQLINTDPPVKLYFQIKPNEAREYKDAVGWEYEGLLKKLVDAKQEYLKVSQNVCSGNILVYIASSFLKDIWYGRDSVVT